MDSELSEEFEAKMRMHQGSVMSLFFSLNLPERVRYVSCCMLMT